MPLILALRQPFTWVSLDSLLQKLKRRIIHCFRWAAALFRDRGTERKPWVFLVKTKSFWCSVGSCAESAFPPR
ncbi:hypothetical protein E2320_005748 [Naja naja]|nr:hypothetical protein E2320_005748 [Naja naja]